MRSDVAELARLMLAHYDARTAGWRAGEPPDLTIAQAYALQAEIARLREERGERVIGYKNGCTSQAIQQQLGVSEPIFGRIFDTGCVPSPAWLSHRRFANLAVEGELAVRLALDLAGASLSDEEILRAIATVFPVIELHHYVLHGSQATASELIASSGMHAGVVLADAKVGQIALAEPAPRLSICIDGTVVGAVAEPWTMGGAVESLRWLAGRLAGSGMRLCHGQVVLTGSPMRLFPVNAGSTIVVEAPPLEKSQAEVGP
jgi:2-keto-4-pentenoate hydratase